MKSAVAILRERRSAQAARRAQALAVTRALDTDRHETRKWLAEQLAAVAESYPDGIRWRGAWKRDVRYEAGDAVSLQGSSYIATQPCHGVRPPATPWDPLALRGKPGQAGRDGRSGAVVAGVAGGLDGAAIPLAEDLVAGDELVLLRDGQLVKVRVSLSDVPLGAITVNGQYVMVNGQYVTVAG